MLDKKLLIIGEAFYPEDFIINDLAKEWSSQGYQVEVLTRNPSYPFGKVYPGYKNKIYQKTWFSEILVHRVYLIEGYQSNKFIKILNYLSFVFFASWVALWIGRKFDKIFVYQTGPLTVALPGNLIKIFYRKPLTIWTQDLWPDTVYAYGFKKTLILEKFLNGLVSFVYNNSDSIAVSCEGFSKRLESYLKMPKAVLWIPNWPIISEKSSYPKRLPGKFNFTFAGNIGKVQNLDKVVLAFKKVSQEFPDAWLNLVGDGSALLDLKLLVDKNDIKNVNFEGRRPLNEMPDYFEGSDVLILSLVNYPIYEIMIPSKFQTYLNYEKPIFAIMNGEVPRMAKNYSLGLSACPDSVEEIELGFRKFLEIDAESLHDMGKNSKKLLEKSFKREKNIGQLTTLTFE